MVITGDNFALVAEWKAVQINYLQIAGSQTLDKASALSKRSDPNEVVNIEFGRNDRWRSGKTIGDWVNGSGADSPQSQVKRYFESHEITELARKYGEDLHGHLIVIVGNRKILCWDVNNDGKLGTLELMEDYRVGRRGGEERWGGAVGRRGGEAWWGGGVMEDYKVGRHPKVFHCRV